MSIFFPSGIGKNRLNFRYRDCVKAGGATNDMRRRFFLLAVLFTICSGSIALEQKSAAGQISKGDGTAPTTKQNHYASALVELNREVLRKEALVAMQAESWIRYEWLSNAYHARAELTGNQSDYLLALNALNRAFLLAGDKRGPVLTRAKLNLSLHRLPAVEPDLLQAESALLIDDATKNTIRGLRADAHLYSGRFDAAKKAYSELEQASPDMVSASRLGNYFAQTGYIEDADKWYAKAEQRMHGLSLHQQAWLILQQGIFDFELGRLDKALAHYQQAANLFPGYWLVEEHIAEIDALQGRTDLAERRYRDLIARTDSAQFKIALAQIINEDGDGRSTSEAASLMAQAALQYESLYKELPESIAGHALSYHLEYDAPSRALQLALENFDVRPGGQSAVQLIQAHAINGQLTEALATLDDVLATKYRTPDLHASAYIVFAATGQQTQARRHRALANKMNSSSIENMGWFNSKMTGKL